jgi:glycosyltransferase involved in cell wall biosynthesis
MIVVNSRIAQESKSGIPYYITELYGALQKHLSKNDIIFLQTSDQPKLGKIYYDKSSVNRLAPWFFDLIGVTRLINRNKLLPKVFHGPAHILPLVKISGITYIVTVHDLAFVKYPQFYNFAFNVYYRLMFRYSLKNADVIVAVSNSTRNDLIKYSPDITQKIKVVYNGVNSYYFTHKASKRAIIPEPYFFTITTHPIRKNTIGALRAYSVSRLKDDYKFVIAGIMSQDHRNMLMNEVNALSLRDNVILFGYATEKDLQNLYTHAVSFIYISFYEGFGFPILEAMLCGCPVITSNISSMPELMPDPKWLVDPYNLEDVRAGIEKITVLDAESRAQLTKKNYKFAKNFTWAKSAQDMHKIFMEKT